MKAYPPKMNKPHPTRAEYARGMAHMWMLVMTRYEENGEEWKYAQRNRKLWEEEEAAATRLERTRKEILREADAIGDNQKT